MDVLKPQTLFYSGLSGLQLNIPKYKFPVPHRDSSRLSPRLVLLYPPTAIPQLKEIPMDFFFLVSITLRAFFRRGWCLPPASRGKRFSGLLYPPTAITRPKKIPLDYFLLMSITLRALLYLGFRSRE